MRPEARIISPTLLGVVAAQLNAAQQHFNALCPAAHEQPRVTGVSNVHLLLQHVAQPIIDRTDYPWWLFMARGEPETTPPMSCPPGFHLSDGECVPDELPGPSSCPEGMIWDGTDCVATGVPICDERLDKCKSRCEGEKSACDAEQSTCKEEKARCESEKATCEAERGNFMDEKNRCEGERSACEAERETLREEKNRCEGQRATCETDRKNCQQDKSRCEGEKTACEADRDRFRDEKTRCEGQKATCDTQNSACQKEKGTSETQRRTCHTEKESLSKRIVGLKNDLKKSRADLQAATRPPPAPATCPGAARGALRNVGGVNFRLYCNAATHGTAWETIRWSSFDACLANCAVRPQCVQFDFKAINDFPAI
ncbi:hypothetical protein N8T08_006166 [Aspergillus melleus]|uniref:Uncharacterized protein n=1 Tax=Aspergillus melleus TaxID=138277 RepID=A0ACC3B0D3_9EURO|nr:hypothetical protein N8T08_006166 [Aspergillus melleus]